MLFSSVAAIHAIALAASRDQGPVDLDVIPVYGITGTGLIIASIGTVSSKTIRQAKDSVHTILVLWGLLMVVGVVASIVTLYALPDLPLSFNDLQEALDCKALYNATLPIRKGQDPKFVSYHNRDFGFYVLWTSYAGFTSCLIFFGYSMLSVKAATHLNVAFDQRIRRKKICHGIICLIVYGSYVSMFILPSELIIMMPPQMPYSEDVSAIGQWGPPAGVFLAFLASGLKAYMDRSAKATAVRVDIETPLQRDPDSMSRRSAEVNEQELAEGKKLMPSRRNTF